MKGREQIMSEFKVTRYRIRTEEGRGPDRPFSVVFLSDLHNASYGEENEELLSEIRNENPEAVFVAGDMVTAGPDVPQMDAALGLMDELTKRYPVYYANGNHESRMKQGTRAETYERYANTIRSFGVHLLENTKERIELQRMPVTVWGLELESEYFRRGIGRSLSKADVLEKLGEPDAHAYNILLAHHPCYFPAYASWGAQLSLSGHLHGGLVRLPFLGGVVSPQLRLFPRYDRGLYTENGKKMIVSAGLGSHTVNLRINNPPELIVIDFVR